MIKDIISSLRKDAGDTDTLNPKYVTSRYLDFITGALNDLEKDLGKLTTRMTDYPFTPLRDGGRAIVMLDDGVTPAWDTAKYFFDEEEADNTLNPVNVKIDAGLVCEDTVEPGIIESAVFMDDDGGELEEADIVFIRLVARYAENTGSVTIDVSLDDRNTWLVADRGYEIDISGESTGFIDVSDLVTSKSALRWTLTNNAKLFSTVFERYSIPREKLRKYMSSIIDFANMRRLNDQLTVAIARGSDPVYIDAIRSQIDGISVKYGWNMKKPKNDIPSAAAGAVSYGDYGEAEGNVMGKRMSNASAFLTDPSVIEIRSDGTIRRTG